MLKFLKPGWPVVHLFLLSSFLFPVSVLKAQTVNKDKVKGNVADKDTLLLKSKVKMLRTVTINAKIPFIERRADKVIVNLDNSISAGTSMMEMMDKLPGVQVDPNDQISLNGKIVQVYIDGKATTLSADALSSLLRGMSSANVQKIELIAHPSAKYDAAGSGGIINIVKKKNHKEGLTGNIYGGLGQGNYGKQTGGISINFKNNTYNLLLNTNYSYNKYFLDSRLTSDFYTADQQLTGQSIAQTNSIRNNRAYTPNIGLDLYLSKKTTLSLTTTNGVQLFNKDAGTYTQQLNADGSNVNNSNFLNLVHTSTNNFSSGLHLVHQVDTAGKEYTIDFDYLNYTNHSDQNNQLTRYDPAGDFLTTERTLFDQSRGFNIYTLKTDYTIPLKKQASIEAGWKSSDVVSNNSNELYDVPAGVKIIDPSQTDRFSYHENINAIYSSYHKNDKKFSYTIGLRAENTWGKGIQMQTGETFNKRYFQLFPSAFFDYKFNDQYGLTISLDKKTDRPTYENLNPLIRIVNSNNYLQGNPDLKPVVSYNGSATWSFKNAFFLIFDYSINLHDFTTYSSPYDAAGVITTKPVNNRHTQYFSIITGYNKQIRPWWYSVSNINFKQQSFESIINGYHYNRPGMLSFNFDSYHSFSITKLFSFQLLLKYRGRAEERTIVTEPYFFISSGVRQQLFGKRGSIALNVTDPFNSFKNRYSQNSVIIRQLWDNHYESRVFRLNFSYNFGGTIKKTKSGTAAENEKKRTEAVEN